MKRKKRVKRGARVASLRASADVEQQRSMDEREQWKAWRKQDVELRRWRRVPKKRVTMNLDADVLAWFRQMGRGYQREINRALRKMMDEETKSGE